jgi:translation initiation factor 5B
MEANNKPIGELRSGSCAIAIEAMNTDQAHITVGRHFDESDQICSYITRQSIDALKAYWKDEMTKDDWKLIMALKKQFKIP